MKLHARKYLSKFALFTLINCIGFIAAYAHAGTDRLQLAISMCQVEHTARLLQDGANPNEKDRRGKSVLNWLGSSTKCSDATALATAEELQKHGAKFQTLHDDNPNLLTNLAHRGFANTVAFLCKTDAGDPSRTLRAIARKGDVATIRVLLKANADPLQGVALTSALFDASAAGQTESVAAMLEHVKDKQAPKVLAAYEIAEKSPKKTEVTKVFLDAGVKPPKARTPKEIPCERKDLTAAQADLLARLGLPNAGGLSGMAGAMTCKFIQECGDLALFDCNSAADGPAYYVNQKTNTLISTCGGACMRGCKDQCPPKEWTCSCKF